MATIDIIKTSGKYPTVGFNQFLDLSKRSVSVSWVLYMIAVSQLAYAESNVTPTFGIREVVVDREFQSFSETGYVTTVSPGVNVNMNGAKSDFSLVYAFDAIRSNGLERDDRDFHELALNGEFRHKPNQWTSFVRSSNRLVNRDIDGLQSTDPDIIDDNSEELFTFVAGTSYSERLTKNIQYSAGLEVNYADEEDSDSTSGQEVTLSSDNFISENNLTWRAQVQSSVEEDEDDDQQIDELEIIFNYRFNQTLSTFLLFTATETDFDDLNDDSTLIGIRWSPTRQSFVSVGLGKRGDDDTYELDARITRAHSLFSASYSESVTSVRDQLFNLPNDQFGQSTQQSSAITPILRKRADIAWTLTGIRSAITFSIFRDEESNPDIADDEETTGGEIEFSRQLSPRSGLSLAALIQDTDFTQESTLEEFRVSYRKSTSETAAFQIFASNASFESTDETNEYEQASIGASYRIAF